MATEREQRLERRRLDEALDGNLAPEERQRVLARAEADPTRAAELQQMRALETQLRTTGTERAPQRLAAAVMMQVARGVQLERLPREQGLAAAVGLALLAVVVLPALVTASWLLLNAVFNPVALHEALAGLVGVVALAVTLLPQFIQTAQDLLQTYPALPLLAALVPLALVGLYRTRYTPADDAGAV